MPSIVSAQGNTALLKELSSFIGRNSKWCVSLTEKILSGGRGVSAILVENSICGVLALEGSILFPYIPEANPLFSEDLRHYLAGHIITCVSGKSDSVKIIRQEMERRGFSCTENRSLLLMEKQKNPFFITPALPKGLQEVHCSKKDADSLMPLQLSYTKEEVLPIGHSLLPSLVRHDLDDSLCSSTVLALKKDDEFVAKAHCRPGKGSFCLLGGVYTKSEWRKKGCASYLTARLSKIAGKEGKTAVLFVRSENQTAIHAYQRAGFKSCGEYSIIYF